MAGNVWEWVSDWYEDNYYKNSPPRDPKGPSNGKYRVVRGGSWDYVTSSFRVSNRLWYYTTSRNSDSGFRCVR